MVCLNRDTDQGNKHPKGKTGKQIVNFFTSEGAGPLLNAWQL